MTSKLDQRVKEANLPGDFREADVAEITKLINYSSSFSVVGMPAMGISIFLRFLCTLNLGIMIHVDIYELPDFNPTELFKLLFRKLGGQAGTTSPNNLITSCKEVLEKLVVENNRVVIVFNRFDSLKKSFTREFFAQLRSLIDVDREKVVMIFAANRPLTEEFPAVLEGGNLGKFSVTYFLVPYSAADLRSLLKLNSPGLLQNPNLELAIKLSGGHYQLLLVLLRSELLFLSPLADPALQLQLQQLFSYLKFREKKALQKVVSGRKVKSIDPLLLKTGFVKFVNGKLSLFSLLFASYVKEHLRLKLPFLEAKLFGLLKTREEKIVTKEEIFKHLWGEDIERTSDWALNALIYRLRKNPTFMSTGFEVESLKKQGYRLVRN